MPGLDDLPSHRQLALRWRYLPDLDDAAIDTLVGSFPAEPCKTGRGLQGAAAEPAAVRGSDGRVHLVVDGYWWADEHRHRLQAPADAWARNDERLHTSPVAYAKA